MNIDVSKSLDELEETDWGKPTFKSHLVITCHELRKKPLKDYEVEDLRIMISQNISPEYLLPLAIKILLENPFACGDCYEGDLLSAVSELPKEFWDKNPDMKLEIEGVINNFKEALPDIHKAINEIKKKIGSDN